MIWSSDLCTVGKFKRKRINRLPWSCFSLSANSLDDYFIMGERSEQWPLSSLALTSKMDGFPQGGIIDDQECSWDEWSCYAFAHFILQRSQCPLPLVRLGPRDSSIIFCFTTLPSPNQDSLSDKCLEEESCKCRAEAAELHFEGFPLCEQQPVIEQVIVSSFILILCHVEPQGGNVLACLEEFSL